jgi:hypothetical protein
MQVSSRDAAEAPSTHQPATAATEESKPAETTEPAAEEAKPEVTETKPEVAEEKVGVKEEKSEGVKAE